MGWAIGGGMRAAGGIAELVRLIVRLAIWHLAFRFLGGFLQQYTHVPWLGSVVIIIAAFVLIRLAMRWYRNRRR
ncbi:hypothetical protein [Actinocatenispora comari]|jgi:mannose/fructose/N-acetylgalactosamine-specific phosphotransferase system component IIC|uniref:Uncharacterized protein n=1 Tax=Actinocatenispora comari TaxID=2807577 RepID=A0A8J4AHG0_9ACTN|nr:hypothetical protein [Actinocatenispora comari]GIL28758.1 hypothetical protein NUM_40120 [Actinocatenispora comari]